MPAGDDLSVIVHAVHICVVELLPANRTQYGHVEGTGIRGVAAGVGGRAGDRGDTDGEAVAGVVIAVNRWAGIANVVGMNIKTYMRTARTGFCADRLWW